MLDETLCGTWGRPLDLGAQEAVILRLHADGRAVEVFRQLPPSDEVLAATMRFTAEDGTDVYRVRTETGAKGYLITLRRSGADLIVINRGRCFSHRRLAEGDLPAWCQPALNRTVWR